MRKKRKFIFFTIILTLIFSVNIPILAFAKESIDNSSVENTINNYFSIYFKSLETLETPNYMDVVEENSNTQLYKAINEIQIEQNKIGNLSYQNIVFDLNYQDISINEENAEVSVLMSCKYNYSTTPNSESSMSGVMYKFNLSKRNSNWIITNIDTNFEAFNTFKEEFNKRKEMKAKKLETIDVSTIIDEVKTKFINDSKETAIYLGGSSKADKTEKIELDKIPNLAYSSYSYNTSAGVNYALNHAESRNTYFYYVPQNDCTNFVSQCLWAAYGGYNSGISSRVRMSDNWYAGSGGGSPAWESVNGLWNQVVTNYPGSGPNGTGYNNNAPYYDFAPGRIYLGEILQFRNIDSSNEYTHSVYVTSSGNTNNNYYNEILVSQHTDNWKNRNLWELILNKGGNSCYMRDIAFTSAYLN